MTPLERLRAELVGDGRIDSRRMVVVTAADLALALVVCEVVVVSRDYLSSGNVDKWLADGLRDELIEALSAFTTDGGVR